MDSTQYRAAASRGRALDDLMLQAVETLRRGDMAARLQRRGIWHRTLAWQLDIFGYVEQARIFGIDIQNAWAFRVVDPDGTLRGVEIHRDGVPDEIKWTWLSVDGSSDRPSLFWPPVQWLPSDDKLFITCGNLKTAAMLSAGLVSASLTRRASEFNLNEADLSAFNGRAVFFVYDNAEHHQFFQRFKLAIQSHARLYAFTFSTSFRLLVTGAK